MASQEKIRDQYFHILNVKLKNRKTNRHLNESDYVRIFNDAFLSKKHYKSSSSKHCIFRVLYFEPDKNAPNYLYGTFAQFTYIHNERWFNVENLDFEKEFSVPNGLFPDAKFTDFVFVPKAHRFAYRVDANFKTNPYPVKRFLEGVLTDVCKSDEYVDIDVETDKSSIERILSARIVKHLRIELNYSNQDIGDDIYEFVDNDIRSSNSSKVITEAYQKPNESININESKILKGSILSSVSNGETEAKIIGENGKVEKIKTTDFPRKEKVQGVKSSFRRLVFEKILFLFRNN